MYERIIVNLKYVFFVGCFYNVDVVFMVDFFMSVGSENF